MKQSTEDPTGEVAKILYLYDNTIKLSFKEVGHRYEVFNKLDTGEFEEEGKEVVGVTTILQTVISKGALLNWAVKTATDYMLANFSPDKKYTTEEISEIVDMAKKQHTEEKKKAAGTGTDVHLFIEQYIKAKIAKISLPIVPDENQIAIKNFLNWEQNNNVVWLASERPVYSKKFNYCGTLDFLAKVNNKLTLGDIKTSNFIYPESYFLQIAAYRYALEEERPDIKIENMLIVKVPKTEDRIMEIAQVEDYENNAKAFIHGLYLYRQITKLKNFYKEKYE